MAKPDNTHATWTAARAILLGGFGVYAVLAAVFLVLGFREVVEWDVVRDVLLIVATIGTAIGTLGLAAYTFQLARVTRESVEGAESQLTEVKKQGKSLQEQADAAYRQAKETSRLAAASAESARAATATAESAAITAESSAATVKSSERVRIDAIAPLVNLKVTLGNVIVTLGKASTSLDYQKKWTAGEAVDMVVQVWLSFHFRNVGKSPAALSFGDTSQYLERVKNERLGPIILEPGETFQDEFIQRFVGKEAVDGKLLRFPITYDGLLHGEMFDRIQWNGWVTPMKDAGNGQVTANGGWIINAAAAQVLRSYPNLDRPEEMEQVRLRIQGLEEEPTA